MIGDFIFTNVSFGRDTDFDRGMKILKEVRGWAARGVRAGASARCPRLHLLPPRHHPPPQDPSHTLYFYYAYRRYWDRLRFGTVGGSEFQGGFPTVPFNAGHYRAASDFISRNFGAAPLTVFHWRSEHVDEDMLEPCSVQLAEMLAGFTFPATPSGAHALLLSDMAAPNHQHILWHTYLGARLKFQVRQGEVGARGPAGAKRRHPRIRPTATHPHPHPPQNNAMKNMIEGANLLKYDVTHNDTDTGVLMIRDFLFASVFADQYITCQVRAPGRGRGRAHRREQSAGGPAPSTLDPPTHLCPPPPPPLQGDFLNDCQGCFRSNSNFVIKIMNARRKFGRSNVERWWQMSQADLPTVKLPPIDAKLAVHNARR